jgi:hypothetical protein
VIGASSRLGQQVKQVVAELDDAGLRFALIGGLALAAHHVVRATSGVDLLVRAEDAPKFARIVAKLGYRCLHESADAASFLRNEEKLGVRWASRENVRSLLDSAEVRPTPFGNLRVVSPAGLLAFPFDVTSAHQDPNLVSVPPAVDPYQALDDLMTVVEALCPVWPDKDLPRITVGFLL